MSINICLDLPQMSAAEYARRQGVSADSVKQLMDSGALPFVQRGRGCVRYVNMVALAAQAAQLAGNQSAWNQPQQIEGIS
ncbi:hypothetical protein [Moritella sp.]|uniref:hypothetical protein n=1 Tax=Moritella sp. TaxID=78556 RepID=UPI001D74ABE3|nr:hypothetical protein [Moritella sp.]MCJ8348039.1 hypothetical protein [Moritella sp.]NQZ42630.1 hypothetical protein [Moritella sp.]